MIVWFLGVPALTGEAVLSGGDLPSVVLTTADNTLLGAAGDIAVFPASVHICCIAPRASTVSIRVPAEV